MIRLAGKNCNMLVTEESRAETNKITPWCKKVVTKHHNYSSVHQKFSASKIGFYISKKQTN
jgi:hypothetical protein